MAHFGTCGSSYLYQYWLKINNKYPILELENCDKYSHRDSAFQKLGKDAYKPRKLKLDFPELARRVDRLKMAEHDLDKSPSQDGRYDSPVRSGDGEELVREFRSGSAQALEVIFDRYHRLVRATAWRVLRDVGEAEDLTQSVFFEISRKAARFDPAKGPLNKWILTLAYHRSLNRKNYLMTRQFYKESLDLIGENGEELWSTSLMLPAQESAHLVNECLGLLDPRQRQVMKLVFFEELTFKEIAEQTQQTFGNVRNQYYRGLKRLRAHLRRFPGKPGPSARGHRSSGNRDVARRCSI